MNEYFTLINGMTVRRLGDGLTFKWDDGDIRVVIYPYDAIYYSFDFNGQSYIVNIYQGQPK